MSIQIKKLTNSQGYILQFPRDNTPVSIGEVILENCKFAKDLARNLYYYDEGKYHPYGEEMIGVLYEQILTQTQCLGLWQSRKISEIIKWLVLKSPLLWEKPPLDKINLLNGIYDLSENRLVEHTSEWLSTVQIPITFDSTASCPEWDKFLSEVLPGLEDYILQIMGILLIPFTKLQMGIFLEGEGQNGKSVLLRGIQDFLGQDNYCTVSMQDLTNNRFMGHRLVGKLANICDDIPNVALDVTTSSNIKSMISCDRISVESKGKDSYTVEPFARQIYSGNQVPKSKDVSFGFRRRVHTIPCTQVFAQNPQKAIDLELVLKNPIEQSGLLNKVMATIPYTLRHGLRITEGVAGVIQRSVPMPLSVRWFIDNKLRLDNDGYIPYRFLHEYYSYCVVTELDPKNYGDMIEIVSAGDLTSSIKSVFSDLQTNVQHWYGKNRNHKGYRGIALTDNSITDYFDWLHDNMLVEGGKAGGEGQS